MSQSIPSRKPKKAEILIAIRDVDTFTVRTAFNVTHIVPVQDIPSEVEMWIAILEKRSHGQTNER